MIVLTLTDCPPSLRGELTKWLLEINTGVYVGNVSARVREQIWNRVQECSPAGRATMVFSSGIGEQRMDFRIHNSEWEPVDFDGLKLILRPSSIRRSSRASTHEETLKEGFSKAAKMRMVKRMQKRKIEPQIMNTYVVVDLETTGLSPENDEIIEIGAVKVRHQEVAETFQSLVKIDKKLPETVSKLTGITTELLQREGENIDVVLSRFLDFVGDLPVVMHNCDFDYSFLRIACERCGFPLFKNRRIDTHTLARRIIRQVPNYKLETLVEHLQISVGRLHRSLDDCFAVMQLYQKLNEFK
jgi:CRISPR-associated protein Cas2